MRNACVFKGECKRRSAGSKKATYISQADTLKLSHDQLVDKVLMRMTPRQFETRCTHNKVHFVLNEQERCNPLWSQPATLVLLGKGPRFVPKAKSLSKAEVQGACAKMGYRLVRAFERYVRKDYFALRDKAQRDAGIQHWTPKQQSLSAVYCRSYVSSFFRCTLKGGGAWKGNQMMSPFFEQHLNNIERDIVATATRTRKLLPAKFRWPNITQAERSVLLQMSESDIGYNIADKNRGPVVYSKDLYREQCRLHLEDDKGTYGKVEKTKEDILEDVLLKLKGILIPFKKHGEGWKAVCESIIRDATTVEKEGKLCKFYLIWKLHKPANAAGIRTRPIAAAIDYITGPASHFLHCQLQREVWKHKNVLKDSLDLIRIFESFSATCKFRLTTADVAALYPSIRLDRGMAALRWFMDNHTSFNQTLKDLCLRLANFVLTNNYVQCKELGGDIYHQHIGTAMGTSFSVVYAVIFMIHLESPILEDPRFRSFIQLYKRFIDDIFLIWTGSATTLCEFRRALGSADDTIKLDWGGYESQAEALDHTVVEAKRHDRAEFLDLDICVERSRPATRTGIGSWYLTFRPYRKPGNAHAYIPFTSFHARHTFRGWVLAELLRLLTHSSTVDIWQEEGEFFYHCLCSRGYPRDFLRAVFREITWGRRVRMLEPKRKEQGDQFFETYRACVLTLRNAPEWPALKSQLDLNLKDLVESTYGDIFPPRVFLAQCNAPRLGSILKR
jgi:hypothetical protein